MKPHMKVNTGKQERPPDEAMTMVISLGEVGTGVKDLVADLKKVLNPFSFNKLKARSKNKLKDFVDAATPLGAKMLILLRNHLDDITLSLAKFPRGPTMHFDVKRFCTMSDIHRADMQNTVPFNKQEKADPFLVLSGFSESDEDQALTAMFQGLFPSILVGALNLNYMKRVVSVTKEGSIIQIRHYKVTKRDLQGEEAIGMMFRDREFNSIDFGKYESVDELVMEKLQTTKTDKKQCALRLHEIGPRIDMELRQAEVGLFGGMKVIDEDASRKDKQYHYRPPKKDKKARPDM